MTVIRTKDEQARKNVRRTRSMTAENRHDARLQPLTPQAFRDVIGHFASGVTVITTTLDGVRHGTTASAVSSLSLEPPMLLVCMNRSSATGQALLRSGRSRSTSSARATTSWRAASPARATTSSRASPSTPASTASRCCSTRSPSSSAASPSRSRSARTSSSSPRCTRRPRDRASRSRTTAASSAGSPSTGKGPASPRRPISGTSHAGPARVRHGRPDRAKASEVNET